MNPFQARLLAKCDRIVEEGLRTMSNPYVSCSWGKDSTFLLWLVLRHRPDIPILYIDYLDALPDTYAIRDQLLGEWDLRGQYTELAAEWDWRRQIEVLGLSDITRTKSSKAVIPLVKGHQAERWAQEQGHDGRFWGLRADESATRRRLFRARGALYQARGQWVCSPLAWLTGHELWYLIDSLGIPYCAIYDKTLLEPRETIRNGGWACTDGALKGRVVWLRYYYPDLYERLREIAPEVDRLS